MLRRIEILQSHERLINRNQKASHGVERVSWAVTILCSRSHNGILQEVEVMLEFLCSGMVNLDTSFSQCEAYAGIALCASAIVCLSKW